MSSSPPDAMHAYYSARAPYMAKNLATAPTGQLAEIIATLQSLARDRAVLEVACGTGYWTRQVAPVAAATTAVDFSSDMLAVARGQGLAGVRFLPDDAYQLGAVGPDRFDFGFAMHWVSHLPVSRWAEFFRAFHRRLKPGAKVLLADDIRRDDDTDPFYSRLDNGDSYELRHLPNGRSYEIVKRYFSPAELHRLLKPYAENIQVRFERPRWWLTYDARTD